MTKKKSRSPVVAKPVVAKPVVAQSSVVHAFMKRMAPSTERQEQILPASALMCHICLLNSVVERAANRCLEQQDLTLPQWMALGCIGNAAAEGIKHSELGKRLMLSKAPITGIVDRLERGGYVQRVADQKDRRISRIVITAKGEATWQSVRQTLRKGATDFYGCLTDAEQQTLLSLLARVLDSAAKADPILATIE
ncbi:MAG TPA: MarR family transcriptional regulator [Abditibacteriaceae bacterium]|nr:MarR family transcriptional regulator [Abditibacteriaceae bacterium]